MQSYSPLPAAQIVLSDFCTSVHGEVWEELRGLNSKTVSTVNPYDGGSGVVVKNEPECQMPLKQQSYIFKTLLISCKGYNLTSLLKKNQTFMAWGHFHPDLKKKIYTQ